MRIVGALVMSALLVACGEQTSEADRAAAVGEVKQANEGVALAIEPQKITYPDIEQHELYGASCAFVPEGGGLAAIALAMVEGGYIKLDGEIVTLAPDTGTGDIGPGARMEYDGLQYSFGLAVDESGGQQFGEETMKYPANLTIRDEKERVVYEANGIADCGA